MRAIKLDYRDYHYNRLLYHSDMGPGMKNINLGQAFPQGVLISTDLPPEMFYVLGTWEQVVAMYAGKEMRQDTPSRIQTQPGLF